ncbi:hypothetical protein [uncultured Thiodictyon sp.]|uniref:hypothetical protein n=1 Tax=uncultured Thiodictyon sp. TaxID=1846217 RepID=UPI0025F6E3E3|nr:hypothetical protein [uncultured Thiodictyon sp.]
MKNRVRRFKNLVVALRELEPFIRDGEHLQTGKPFRNLGGMRSREALGNWLICVVANFESEMDRFSFTTDPTGGDGVVYDDQTSNTWLMEHVMVPRTLPDDGVNAGSVEAAVLAAIDNKRKKGGAAYASGKQLVVFLNSGGGQWYPCRVAKQLTRPLLFNSVWIVGLQSAQPSYVYGVTQLDAQEGPAQIWLVRIGADFASWAVERIQ